MAERFIVGATTEAVVAKLATTWAEGFATTLDFLGEKTVTAADADAYAAKVLDAVVRLGEAAREWPERPLLERDPWGQIGRANVSIKPTALSPHLVATSTDLGVEEAIDRLVPVLAAAKRHRVTLNFDTEHDESKDAIFTLVRTIGERWPDGPDLGCVVQAYRRDAETDLTTMIEWSRRRVADGAAPLQIRLVKGAYWDAETIAARANGWPSPVWTDKAETDRNYERLTGLLMAAAGAVRPAIASHNVRSIAYAATLARAIGLPADAWEVQVLHGMAEPLHEAVRESGLRVRVYRPVGELVPGMAYLVRRLLENTANESFVRNGFRNRDISDRDLSAPTPPAAVVDPTVPPPSSPAPIALPDASAPFVNEPPAELRRPGVRARYAVRHSAVRLRRAAADRRPQDRDSRDAGIARSRPLVAPRVHVVAGRPGARRCRSSDRPRRAGDMGIGAHRAARRRAGAGRRPARRVAAGAHDVGRARGGQAARRGRR